MNKSDQLFIGQQLEDLRNPDSPRARYRKVLFHSEPPPDIAAVFAKCRKEAQDKMFEEQMMNLQYPKPK